MKYLLHRGRSLPLLFLLGALQFSAGCASTPQTTYASPDEAARALVAAARLGSADQLKHVLGSHSDDLISSGDPVADQNALQTFVDAYDQKHQISMEAEDSAVLVVGNNDWPLPMPIVRDQSTNEWYFDTEAGQDEMINRRIGRNELDCIEVCLAIVDAQREYAMGDADGNGWHDYARKFLSDPGSKNGLYWPAREGEPESPLGELVAEASEEGYAHGKGGEPRPFHGYRYRLLTSQGESANGGSLDYVVGGKMIGGFGVVAYPADHGNSGIMTFIVNHEGVVYQRDLGAATERTAGSMTAFDPGTGWAPAPAGESAASRN